MKGFASGLPDFEDAFCALLWRWALKNVGTCFLQAPRSKKLSIRYVFKSIVIAKPKATKSSATERAASGSADGHYTDPEVCA